MLKFEATAVLVDLANDIIALANLHLSANIAYCRKYLMEFGRTSCLAKLACDIIATENRVCDHDLIANAGCVGSSNEANTNEENHVTDQDLITNLSQNMAENPDENSNICAKKKASPKQSDEDIKQEYHRDLQPTLAKLRKHDLKTNKLTKKEHCTLLWASFEQYYRHTLRGKGKPSAG